MTFEEKVQRFADMVDEQVKAQLRKEYPNLDPEAVYEDGGTYAGTPVYGVTVKPGKKYTKVDVGSSGKYMVEHSTGMIFGIKGYGVVHRGHQYGTLDTIDDWDWGGYAGHRRGVKKDDSTARVSR